jgi:hypothetical protein
MICEYATDRDLFRFEAKLKSTARIAQYSYLLKRYFSFLLPLVMLVSSLTAVSIFPAPIQASATPLTCAQGGPCSIGEVGPAGGIVIYVGSSTINQVTGISAGGIYLEAAPTGFTTATYNWCDGPNNGNATLIGAANPSLGSGASNTAIMVSKCAAGAGNVAANYSKNGYSDWFLPTTAELSYLSSQKVAIGLSDSAVYWGSNETFAYIAASLITLNGQVGGQNKAQETPLWPIRAFSPGDPLPGPQVAITRASFGSERKNAFITQTQITIQDASSNTVTSSSAVVTATVSAGGTLVGATTATASSGIATFTNLGLDGTVGTTYTITYTAPGLTPATASVTLGGTTCDGATFTCQVGDTGPGGGLVFYVAPSGGTFACGQIISSLCKYLEAAPITGASAWTDNRYAWSGNINTAIGSTSTAIGSGYSNTLKMVRQIGAGTAGAGSAARGYRGGGLNDWYLPSKDELNQITLNQVLLSATAGYWSSSEATATGAWDQGSNGIQGVADPGKQQTTPVRPIRAFGSSAIESAIIYVPAIAGVTAPVKDATPVTTVTAGNGFTGTVSWSGSPTTFAPATTYTATITLTPTDGFTLSGVTANFFTVAGTSIPATNAINSGTITAVFPTTAAPPPVLSQYLTTLTSPKIILKDGKLVCTPGTYNAGYTLEGVIQGSSTALFSPSSFIYNLLINGVVQSALATASSITSNSWNMPTSASGSLLTCSVTVSVNGVTNTDKSSDNTSGVSSALSTQSAAISAANATYTAALLANDKVYQKALVDNRAKWRADTEKIRTDYYAERDRIRTLPSTKVTRGALASTALKVYTAAQKKSAADYKASQPAALAAKDSANKVALDANKAAIAGANAAYGTFIESIGYGVLIP